MKHCLIQLYLSQQYQAQAPQKTIGVASVPGMLSGRKWSGFYLDVEELVLLNCAPSNIKRSQTMKGREVFKTHPKCFSCMHLRIEV